ncbi:MAG: Rieske 2Fe-2S domain-containing protein [Phycisphaerales bacterium]|nr:Rieske 2Fe-2S domain-containing protein [Phycisphaerales bacterium]
MTDAAPATTWITLGRLDAIPVGRARYVEAAGRPLCVVRTSETEAIVFDDACPHAGSSLSGGHVEDGCLVCPLHQWPFRVADGVCADATSIAVRKHACRVRDGLVELADPGPR